MRVIAFLPLLIGALASAQNWALLNPAYKYNFGNDGSDTISNQVFVTDIDTLGVDSFRYELNNIGVWCDGCPGPPQGGGWLIDQPQFMGLRATVSTNSWFLEWSDLEVTIKPQAASGESWTYDLGQNLTATVTNLSEEQVYGILDSVKVISLSNGGSIRIAKAHGLLEFPGSDGGSFQALGIQELALGSVIPAADAFFALMPGDVVQYHTEGYSETNFSSSTSEYVIKYTITDRYTTNDTLVLVYSAIRAGEYQSYMDGQGGQSGFVNDVINGAWRVPSTDYVALGLISSYPGQVIYFAPNFNMYPNTLFCIAEHGIDDDGQYFVRARQGNNYVVFGSPNTGSGEGPYGGTYYTYSNWQAAEYRTGPGLQRRRYGQASSGSATESQSFLELTGSVIAGDTIGNVLSDSFLGVGTNAGESAFRIGPDPANDRLVLHSDEGLSGHYSILDLGGRLMHTDNLTGVTRQEIDVAALAEGMYVLVVVSDTRQEAQRFIIAR